MEMKMQTWLGMYGDKPGQEADGEALHIAQL
jgi:hypothetical protein